jgi:hypothetical protein
MRRARRSAFVEQLDRRAHDAQPGDPLERYAVHEPRLTRRAFKANQILEPARERPNRERRPGTERSVIAHDAAVAPRRSP